MGNCLGRSENRDNVAYRKKTDDPTPDDKYKEVVRDSGIEASGETEQDSMQGVVPPANIGPLSQVKEKETVMTDTELVKEDDSSPDENGVAHRGNGPIVMDDSDTTNLHPESEAIQNGVVVEIVETHNTEVADGEDGALEVGEDNEQEEELEDMKRKRWSFPPILDDFDLMTTEKDPAELEDIFADERLKEVNLRIEAGASPGLGITIVGGANSPNGDLPMLIKRVVPGSLVDQEGTIKPGDELIAVNETLLAGVEKDYAVRALSNLDGNIRLLVLQDD